MIITPDTLRALNTAYSKAFDDAILAAPTVWQSIAMLNVSKTASTTYGWLGAFPKMQEWINERQRRNMKAQAMILVNRKFESTVDIERTDIEDDNLGLYTPMISQMGQSAAQLPDELVFEALKNGETSLCYDGQNFFDADHPIFANADGTGALTPVSNLTAGAELPFYILDTTNFVKPLVYQERLKAELDIKTNPSTSDDVFNKDIYSYGARARGAAGYGLWQFAHKSSNKLNKVNVSAIIAQMQSIKGDGGKVLNLRPNVILVPPALADAAFELFKADTINGTTNSMKGRLEPIVTPYLV